MKRFFLAFALLVPSLASAQVQVKLNDTTVKIPVMAIASSDHVTRKTDVSSLTCRRIKNGTEAACGGTSAEVSDANQPGLWSYSLASGDVDTLGSLVLTFSATGMDTFSTAVQVGGVSVMTDGIAASAMAAEGTAQGYDTGSKLYVDLVDNAPYGEDSLNGNASVYINSATTGAGQTACICDYATGTERATLCKAMPIALSGTVTYTIIPTPNCNGHLLAGADVQSGNLATLKLKQLEISNSSGIGLSVTSSSSDGARIWSTATNYPGLRVYGTGTGDGLYAVGGDTAGSAGIRATGGSGGGYGFHGVATGSGYAGLSGSGGSSGYALRLAGTNGYNGAYISSTAGGEGLRIDAGSSATDAVLLKCTGGNCNALKLTNYGTGSALSGALVAANVSAAAANKIADHVIRRNTTNIEASSDGDTLVRKSLYGAIAQQTHKIKNEGGYQKVYKADGLTLFASRALTTQSGAAPIVEIGD